MAERREISSRFIETSRRKIPLRAFPLWMAIINATPDSFSDGGLPDPVRHAMKLVHQGADILDVGGESTRPGSLPVSPETEIERITPVIRGIFSACRNEGISPPPISVDTRNPETALAAIREGAEILNDITGGENPQMRKIARENGTAFIFMHMRGTPRTMQISPCYEDVVEEVFAYLAHQRDLLLSDGIQNTRLVADPGIGFGKTTEHNLEILRNIRRFHDLDVPILVGHSRKHFLEIFGEDRREGTEKVSGWMAEAGVEILRLHEKPK